MSERTSSCGRSACAVKSSHIGQPKMEITVEIILYHCDLRDDEWLDQARPSGCHRGAEES